MMAKLVFLFLLISLILGFGFTKYINKDLDIRNITQSDSHFSDAQLKAIASNKYKDGNLPLGDNRYVIDKPKKGYIYLCDAHPEPNGGGAQTQGSWIHGNSWNINEKISVLGKNSWRNASFFSLISDTSRTFIGNNLPNHTTGDFPISDLDPAYKFDRNPNSIKAQSLNLNLPLNPVFSKEPNCIGGEVGIMLSGVSLFDGFDAGLRDAAAWEVQDFCQGHPQKTGQYHYHSLSSCINDVSVKKVIGFALDGFPITGPQVTEDTYLTTEDLDECHGITSNINLDGKEVNMYHYVMTMDFPYSVSCFKGEVKSHQVIPMNGNQLNTTQKRNDQITDTMNNPKRPPQEAFDACSDKTTGVSCLFNTPNKTITGSCQTPPGQTSLVCVPSLRPQ